MGLGAHQISVRQEGYISKTLPLMVESAESIRLSTIVLSPEDISARLFSTPSKAVVLVDDRYAGVTPVTLKLEPFQEYQLKVMKSGYADRTLKIVPDVKKDILQTITLEKKSVLAEITANILTELYLNDSLKGSTPISLSV